LSPNKQANVGGLNKIITRKEAVARRVWIKTGGAMIFKIGNLSNQVMTKGMYWTSKSAIKEEPKQRIENATTNNQRRTI